MNAPRVGDQFITWYFLSRGYAVAMPVQRGYAHSWGHLTPHGCDVLAIGNDAAKDIRKVLDDVKDIPGIDASQIVVAGKSMGGWSTLVFGAQNPADVKGLLNFAGGVKEGDCGKPDESLITAAGDLGSRTRLASIWFYGDNDQTFSTATWKGMYAHYTAAGGRAQLVDYADFQKDAHAMTASGAGLPLWIAKAEAFLQSIGMPGNEVNPEYLPRPEPKASGYASINDFSAVPYLNARQKTALFASYLAATRPRAFAIARDGGWGQASGIDSINAALVQCANGHEECRIYSVDGDVVWAGR
ncbi:alpha/beta hydrolase family protein [Paraburkholderia sp. BR10937]|uniref:alpha/beta hydrolase family protein n=1 Tax=Paraburkholderia sp. BR10937 TaxID=3236994 RepID=UPI0034D1A628